MGRRLCVAALMALACAAPAAAQSPGQFGISPSTHHEATNPPADIGQSTVFNATQAAIGVRVFPVVLRQELDGAYSFADDPRALRTAQLMLDTTPARFTLTPGTSRSVKLRWEALARGKRAAYLGIVFQGIAPARPGQVTPVLRILGTAFLRRPGPHPTHGSIEGLRVLQDGRTLRFFPRVRNRGRFLGRPHDARLVIRDARGHVVLDQAWPGQIVLPGYQREFNVQVTKVLPAGRYTATVRAGFGRSKRLSRTLALRLVGPNQLPVPGARIDAIVATGEVGQPAHVRGTLQSIGTAPVSTRVRVRLYRFSDLQHPVATTTQVLRDVPARSRRKFDVRMGHVERGQYQAILTYATPGGATQTLQAGFTATKRRPFSQRVRDWVSRNAVVLLLALLGLLLALFALSRVRLKRRYEQRLREATGDASPPDGEDEPPPSPSA